MDSIENKVKYLQEMEAVDSASALQAVRQQISRKSRIAAFWQVYRKVAAVLILPFIGISIYLFFSERNSAHSITTSSPYGLVSEIMLPDSSVVILNSNSSLVYPSEFRSAKRNVSLNGEAYFKVKSDSKHPFTVDCNGLEITAVGTEFNIEGYGDKVITSLVKGKVNIYQEKYGEKLLMISMTPGQAVEYLKEKDVLISKNPRSLYGNTAWMDGKIVFEKTSLKEVTECMSRYGDMAFEFEPGVNTAYSYTGTFNKIDIEKIFDYIEYTTPVNIALLRTEPGGKKIYRVSSR